MTEAGGDRTVLARPIVAKKRYGRAVASLAELLESLDREDLDLAERLRATVEHYRVLMAKKYDDAERRLRDLEALSVVAGRYRETDAFLADLAIEPPEVGEAEGGPDREDEWVTLSTVHSAKGLEWRAVFVLSLVVGCFPSWQSLRDGDDYEEERRLLYVAMTRAKERLYLLKPEEVSRRGGHYDLAELSPLLTEISGFFDLVDVEEVAFADEAAPDDGPGAATDEAQLRRIEDYFAD